MVNSFRLHWETFSNNEFELQSHAVMCSLLRQVLIGAGVNDNEYMETGRRQAERTQYESLENENI